MMDKLKHNRDLCISIEGRELTEVIEILQKYKTDIGLEGGFNMQFNIDNSGNPYLTYQVSETDTEFELRKAKLEKQNKLKKDRDLAELARLKKLYPDG